MDELNENRHWYAIAEAISEVIVAIVKTEAQLFSEISNRHGLLKINKKLYEALEIAQKALDKGETK